MVLCIGIVAFAFVALFALIPMGLTTFRKTVDTTVGSQIAQRVLNEAQQTDFDLLTDGVARETNASGLTFRAPSRTDERLRYFDEQGNEVVPAAAGSLSANEKLRVVYHVLTRIMLRPARPGDESGTALGAVDLASVTVQIATNPGNRTIPIHLNPPAANDESDPQRNLFEPAEGVNVSTWTTLIARNQPSIPAP